MPIYEYHCDVCGTDFECMQKTTDPTPTCVKCGATDVVKKVSATSFVLKGTGWYATDFRDKTTKEPKKKSPKPVPAAEPAPKKAGGES